MKQETKTEINNLLNNRQLIENARDIMPEVKVNGVVTWDMSVTFTDDEIKEMFLEAIDKKLSKLGTEIDDFKLTQDISERYINGISILQEVEEEAGWSLRDRRDFVEELKYTWIPEAKRGGRDSDLALMEEDLALLEGYEDEMMLSSTDTNAYLLQSEISDQKEFKEACERLIELSLAHQTTEGN